MDISIIIPTYNRLWSLPMAIDSCKNTRCETEIIVIDDGSDDGTWEWLKHQKNIVAVKQDHFGKCWAANKGYEIATGKYVRFLDSDDMLATNAIDQQYQLAEETEADLVTSGFKAIDEQNKVLYTNDWTFCDDFIAQQLGECDGSHYSAFLFKKDLLVDIPHRPDFAFRDDRLLILEVALKNPIVSHHNGYSLLHRIHNNGRLQVTTGINFTVQNYQYYQLHQLILNRLEKQHRLTERYKKAPCNNLWHLAHAVAMKNPRDGKEIYDWVYRLNPDFTPQENLTLTFLYKTLGFITTERLLTAIRSWRHKP